MALGVKKLETRGWYMAHRGPLVIAATATPQKHVIDWLNQSWHQDGDALRIMRALWDAGIERLRDLPYGAALCIVNVIDCRRTERVRGGMSKDELAFGDYTTGRWAILTDNCRRFENPIPCKGSQGIWEIDLPTHPDGAIVGVPHNPEIYEL
jgi:hypothetical protein